jgi:hypothetical protein
VFERNNATLAELVASGAYPDVVIADWATYARDRTEWFAPDGIHLRTLGTYAASDYISRKMAHLDGRACPEPVRAGVPAGGPVPRPGRHRARRSTCRASTRSSGGATAGVPHGVRRSRSLARSAVVGALTTTSWLMASTLWDRIAPVASSEAIWT